MSNTNMKAVKDTANVQTATGNGQNSKDQKPELSNLVVNPKPSNEPQKAAEPIKKQIPIEERLKKLEELQELVDKRDSIVDALKNVKTFYISQTGSVHLKFQDSKGFTFGIAHPSVIGEMVAMATNKLEDELKAIEAKIDFQF